MLFHEYGREATITFGKLRSAAADTVYFEARLELSQDPAKRIPWEVHPGQTCLAFSVLPVRDYDAYDRSFTYLGWRKDGLPDDWREDVRSVYSTVGLERPYARLRLQRPNSRHVD